MEEWRGMMRKRTYSLIWVFNKGKVPLHLTSQGGAHTFSSNGTDLIDYVCFYI